MSGSEPQSEKLRDEAFAWLKRLTSGEATTADAAALDRWRATSPAHRQAFTEAKLLWRALGPAAEEAVSQVPLPPAPPGGRKRQVKRRAVIAGAAGVTTVAALVLLERPPLGLWPSLAELEADYRTAKGQQRQIELAAASLELNTQTSVALRPAKSDSDRIELISGEAAVTANSTPLNPFVVIAGNGQTVANQANFSVRYTESIGSVTCLAGQVSVECGGASVSLQPNQQITYDSEGFSPVAVIDPAVVMAWQQGLLVFRHVPFAKVVEEVNRYRVGRVILMNDALARQLVFASFRIDHIEDVVPRMQAVFGFRVTTLPAGVVVIS